MQYVNDDMDELFKRAAENYPLDTNSADWDKVLAALQNETGTQIISEKKKNKNGRFLWLLLLLPIGLICNQVYSPGGLGHNRTSEKGVTRDRNSDKMIEVNRDKSDNINNTNKVQNSITDNNTTVVNSINRKGSNPNPVNLNLSASSTQDYKKSTNLKSGRSKSNAKGYNYSIDRFPGQNGNNSVAEQEMNNELFSHSYVFGIALDKNTLSEFSTSVKKEMSPLLQSPEHKENIRLSKRKKFYAGLIGGVDATTIKFQKIEDVGFSYGMIFGYQLNKKWSVETGALLEKKYYYSDAKYLNISKIYLPPNSRIDNASGNCKMIEVPVAVKHNFSTHKNTTWFATLGISSYFMQEEKYTYNYYYGTWGPVPHQKEYKNSSTDLFSAASISAGYMHRLGNFADLRIEPYLKLPMYGMGVGDLPFLSTGLQVGLTKKF